METRTLAVIVSLIAIMILAYIFLKIRFQANNSEEYHHIQVKAYRIRALVFGVLILVVLPVSLYLLTITPYFSSEKAAQTVNITASQWYWDFDVAEVDMATPIEFHVTSTDVNHSFALYSPDGHIVMQTQAMPGYVNKLTNIFTKPGVYQVLCLEYCGIAHHSMIADFTVVGKD